MGSLRDYQKEFEKRGNKVQSWTQKALVETFLEGFRSDTVNEIRMFKLNHSGKLSVGQDEGRPTVSSMKIHTNIIYQSCFPISSINNGISNNRTHKLANMGGKNKRRVQGLCFDYEDKFSSGHN